MNRARKIFIYTDISQDRERRLKQRTLPELLRNRARRAFDFAQWRTLGRVRFQHYSYADREFSNLGDIAIRIAIEEDLRRTFAPAGVEFIEYGFGDLNADVVERANREADLLVITGGAYIHYNSEGSINRRLREDLPYVEKLTCPVITFGISISSQLAPGRDMRTSQLAPESMELLRRFRHRLALCSVRDEQSLTIFEAAAGQPIHLITDPVLFLQHPGTANLPEGPRVGVNLTFHGAHADRLLERNLKIYIAGLKTLQSRTGCRFFYLAHSDGERLIIRLLWGAGIALETAPIDVREMLSWYRAMDIVICQMLHASIFSANAGTPFLNLAYDVKNLLFCEALGVPEYCIPSYELTAEQLTEKAVALLKDRERVAAMIAERKATLRVGNEAFLVDVAALVQ